MEQHDAGVVQGNERNDEATETSATKFGSGLHESSSEFETRVGNTQQTDTPVEPLTGSTVPREESPTSDRPDGTAVVSEESAVPAEQPEQQAFVGADGQVHQVPPELIGPDGKMLPFNERTLAMLRGKYFTVRHDLMPCGHKIDRINQPKNNCDICWWNWLNIHRKLIETAHEFYQQYGKERLVAMRGAKFVRMFLRYMSTVAHLLEEQKAQEKLNGNQDSSVGQLGDGTICTEAGEGSTSEAVDGGREVETGQVGDAQPQQ